MRLWPRKNRANARKKAIGQIDGGLGEGQGISSLASRKLHWLSLFWFYKSLPVAAGLIGLFHLLPAIIALLILLCFAILYAIDLDRVVELLVESGIDALSSGDPAGVEEIVGELIDLRILIAIPFVLLVSVIGWFLVRTLQWRAFRYGVENGEIWTRGGLIWKWQRRLPLGHVQVIEFRSTLLNRILRLRGVYVSSASPGRAAAAIELNLVSNRASADILQALQSSTAQVIAAPGVDLDRESEPVAIARASWGELAAAGATSFEFRLSFFAALAVWHFLGSSDLKKYRDRAEDSFMTYAGRSQSVFDFIELALIILALLWVFSILTFMVTFAGFQLRRSGKLALIEHGLLTRRWRTVVMDRIQAVDFVETPVQQPLRKGSLRMELAGSSSGSIERKMLLPSVDRTEALRVLRDLLGELFPDDMAAQLHSLNRLPTSSRRLYLLYWFWRMLPVSLVLLAPLVFRNNLSWSLWWALVPLLLAVLGAVHGYWQFRDAGWLVNDRSQFIVRERGVNRKTSIAPGERLQFRGITRSVLMRGTGTANFLAYVAACGKRDKAARKIAGIGWTTSDGRLRIRGMNPGDARDLAYRLSPELTEITAQSKALW